MGLVEKRHLLDKLCSGLSYSAADHEFNFNESTIISEASFNRNTHKTRFGIDWLTKTMTKGSQETYPALPLGATVRYT